MIKEFALEPEVVASSYLDFCYFVEKFSISKGRVISRFPKAWKRSVYAAANQRLAGVELTKIEERLRALDDTVLFPSGRPGGDGVQPWIERAIEEHARERFEAIIAEANPQSHPDVILKGDIDDRHPRFLESRQLVVPRTADALAGCARFLLAHASEIKIVDPHLNPGTRRWKRPIGRMLNYATRDAARIEVHRSDEIAERELVRLFEEHLIPLLRPGMVLRLLLHPSGEMHNRFVMTDHGGLIYGIGLDDNEEGQGVATDEVTLMDSEVRSVRWADFSVGRLCKEWIG